MPLPLTSLKPRAAAPDAEDPEKKSCPTCTSEDEDENEPEEDGLVQKASDRDRPWASAGRDSPWSDRNMARDARTAGDSIRSVEGGVPNVGAAGGYAVGRALGQVGGAASPVPGGGFVGGIAGGQIGSRIGGALFPDVPIRAIEMPYGPGGVELVPPRR